MAAKQKKIGNAHWGTLEPSLTTCWQGWGHFTWQPIQRVPKVGNSLLWESYCGFIYAWLASFNRWKITVQFGGFFLGCQIFGQCRIMLLVLYRYIPIIDPHSIPQNGWFKKIDVAFLYGYTCVYIYIYIYDHMYTPCCTPVFLCLHSICYWFNSYLPCSKVIRPRSWETRHNEDINVL